MSDSNPFDDLAADDSSAEEAESEVEPTDGVIESQVESESETTTDSPSVVEPTSDPTATDRTDSGSPDTAVDGPTLSNSSPPFPYSDAEQKQMYVQNGLWEQFEDLEFDAELELRRNFEVRNVEQREIDTAVIQLVLERLEPEEIAEMVIKMRGFDPADAD